jgi:Zn-dependent protease
MFIALLKMINFPLVFFVGGLVIHSPLPALPSAIVAVSGPLMNFIIWAFLTIGMKKKLIKHKYYIFAIPLARISLFLAIFNMIPLPGFDGFEVFAYIFKLLF